MRDSFAVLTLNIGNPSIERAERQLEWLSTRSEQLMVLTETCDSRGSRLIGERLAAAGWNVRFPRPGPGERGALVAARVALDARAGDLVPFLPARAELTTLAGGALNVVGIYVPSRDETRARVDRKRRFLKEFTAALARRAARPALLIGDFNVLEPSHRPRRHEFLDWEYAFYDELGARGWEDAYRILHPDRMDYSWIGPCDDGYRFDHAFVSPDLSDAVAICEYVHETRKSGLTDHSAMSVQLTGVASKPLDVDLSLKGSQRALF